jgi:hypothetical protein
MTNLVEAGAATEDELRYPLRVSAGHGDLERRPDHHMHAPARPVDEPVQFGGGVMAQRGTRPTAQDSSPKHRHPGWLACEGGVYASVERPPAADTQLNISEPNAHLSLGELPAGYYAVLEFEQVLAGAGEQAAHD